MTGAAQRSERLLTAHVVRCDRSAPDDERTSAPQPMVELALDAAMRGLPVVPLWWPTDRGCARPMGSACKSAGKHPIETGWQRAATTDPDRIRTTWARHPLANVGIVLRPNDVVIDIDPRSGGDATLSLLEAGLGPLPADTRHALTGGGGLRIFLSLPDDFDGELISKFAGGIDVKQHGGFVVAAGSLHASGRRYEWEAAHHPDDVEIAGIPAPWPAAITRMAQTDHTGDPRPPCDLPLDQRVPRAAACVAKMPAGISGQGGHAATFAVALALVRGFILPREQAREILAKYNLRCEPPWTPRDLEHKLTDAERGRLPRGLLA